jgi:hypothetical protein
MAGVADVVGVVAPGGPDEGDAASPGAWACACVASATIKMSGARMPRRIAADMPPRSQNR